MTGTFLYYARAVDFTMLLACSVITSEQAAPGEGTLKKIIQFLDYITSHPGAILAYSPSNMVLGIHSAVSYLSEPKEKKQGR